MLYDPKEPQWAEILKTPAQLKRMQRKPYFPALFGLMMIVIAKMLIKVHKKLNRYGEVIMAGVVIPQRLEEILEKAAYD